MGFREAISQEARFREKRRGVRMNSRVAVALEWRDETGEPVRLEAHTRIVSPYGCMVVARARLGLNQPVDVINLANEKKNHAVIVWRGRERVEGIELGIELISPEMDFWGLEL